MGTFGGFWSVINGRQSDPPIGPAAFLAIAVLSAMNHFLSSLSLPNSAK